jgi:hypothetical protein
VKPREYEARVPTIALKCYVHIPRKSEEKWEGITPQEGFETGSPKYIIKQCPLFIYHHLWEEEKVMQRYPCNEPWRPIRL